jgi:hypothetical protein
MNDWRAPNRVEYEERPFRRKIDWLLASNPFFFMCSVMTLLAALTQGGCARLTGAGNAAAVAPSITAQPTNQTVTAGQTVTFSVEASGTAPLSYQWRKNGTAISAATSSSYTTPAEPTSDSGSQFTAAVDNSAGTVTSDAAKLTVLDSPAAPLQITTNSLPNAEAGIQFQAGLTATGGVQPYHWSIVAGSLPPGLSLSATSGTIVGMASTNGRFDFSVQVSDSSSSSPQTTVKTLILSVVLSLQITSGAFPTGQVGVPFQASISASGGVAPYDWTVTGGLPPGLTLQTDTDVASISGIPTSAGNFSLGLQAVDSAGQKAAETFEVNVNRASAPAIVQSQIVVNSNSSSSCVVAFPSNTRAGTNLFVFSQWPSTSITASVADTLTNTYITPQLPDQPTSTAWQYTNSSGAFQSAGWLVNRGIGGADTVTVTFSSSVKNACVVIEASGLTYSPQEAVVNANYGGTAGSELSAGPTQALRDPLQLVLCFGGDETNNDTVSASGSYSVLQQGKGGGQYFFVLDETLSSAAGTTPSCSATSSGNSKWMLTMITLNVALGYRNLPQLPLTTPSTTMPNTTGYTQANVCASGCTYSSLATALMDVSCGTVLTLDAGTTYTLDTYNLPSHHCSDASWIIVQSSALASLPASGTRIGPSNLSNMPTIQSGNDDPIIDNSGDTNAAIDHYRFIGLNFQLNVSDNNATYLLYLGSNDATETANNIVIDRCIIQGQSKYANRQGMFLNAANSVVVDSYITEIHGLYNLWADAAAIVISGHGEAGYLIQNNFLSASGHNFVMGGGGSGNVTDVTFKRNYLWKNPCWIPTQGCYVGPHWGFKTMLELKIGTRVLVDSNAFQYEPLDTEPGYAVFVFNPSTAENLGAVDDDVVVRNNLVNHAFRVFDMAGFNVDPNWVGSTMGVNTHRMAIYNNVFDDLGGWGAVSPNYEINAYNGVIDLQIYHNTFVSSVSTDNTASIGNPPIFSGCVLGDNIFNYGNYGILGASGGYGQSALATTCYDYQFGNTALISGTNGVTYPSGTLTPTAWTNGSSGVRFVNYNRGINGDYRLCAGVDIPASPCPGTSILHNAASDGTDVGANVAQVITAIAGVVPP